MKEKIKSILGKYKVIGDTTYGIGYKDAEELSDEIINEVVKVITTHSEHIGDYCDTGESDEWRCRSDCMELAVKRLINS